MPQILRDQLIDQIHCNTARLSEAELRSMVMRIRSRKTSPDLSPGQAPAAHLPSSLQAQSED